MRLNVFILLFSIAVVTTNCSKTEMSATGFVRSLPCDSNLVTVGHILNGEQSVIIVCRSLDGSFPGYLYKVDRNGNLVWKKRLNAKARGCYQVYVLKNNQFAVIGYENNTDNYFTVYTYDIDGNELSAKSIPFNYYLGSLAFAVRDLSSVQIQQLSNGNFVFAYNADRLAMCFTNDAFDTLYYKYIKIQKPGYSGGFIRGIYQNSDSSILFSNATALTTNYTIKEYDIHMIKTNLRGDSLSYTFINDSTHSETPNLMLPLGDNILLVTGRMGEINASQGAWVKYLNNEMTRQISGEINLVKLSRTGMFMDRKSIRNYPANGMIMNASPTKDGGYILCGTVNQSDAINLISPTKVYIMKINAGGRYEWSRIFSTIYPSFGVDVAQTTDGGYIISGYEKALDKMFNPIIIKTDAGGNL